MNDKFARMAGICRGAALALVTLAASGCGPIEYINHSTFQATHAVGEARRAHAEELAPYEYTYAVEMLHKSRELAGFARWQVSVKFAKQAAELGRRAHEKAESHATPSASSPVNQPPPYAPHEGRDE